MGINPGPPQYKNKRIMLLQFCTTELKSFVVSWVIISKFSTCKWSVEDTQILHLTTDYLRTDGADTSLEAQATVQ